ncbi:winged helix-turn-helix domain-containing protein [Plantactinospora sp. GCM10030261]|uniref:winged helix-turn-helix domain-containing protein n=1 Tax=Plantactinospora sp. GCM10030261 TaxID=3273420 RepID=UPI003608B07C
MPTTAKWVWLADRIREQIASGALAPGAKLPSMAEFRRDYGVSQMVVRNAVLVLKSEGLIYGVPGVGVYVADHEEPAANRTTDE